MFHLFFSAHFLDPALEQGLPGSAPSPSAQGPSQSKYSTNMCYLSECYLLRHMALAEGPARGLIPRSEALGQCEAGIRGRVFGCSTPGKADGDSGSAATRCVTSGGSLHLSGEASVIGGKRPPLVFQGRCESGQPQDRAARGHSTAWSWLPGAAGNATCDGGDARVPTLPPAGAGPGRAVLGGVHAHLPRPSLACHAGKEGDNREGHIREHPR